MKTVLFVDDEEKIISSTRRMLKIRDTEYNFDFVIGGKAAIDYINNNKIDLLITDMQMPEICGSELIEYTKEKDPGIKVLAISGTPIHSESLDLLVDRYLSKPCSIDELIETIDEVLE